MPHKNEKPPSCGKPGGLTKKEETVFDIITTISDLEGQGFWKQHRFILYQWEVLPDGKIKKTPISNTTFLPHSAHDTSIHLSYQEAAKISAMSSRWGIGVVISPPYFFLDIDHCKTPDGAWSPTVLALTSWFKDCFIEQSISGEGVHIIGRTSEDLEHSIDNRQYGVALYTKLRFCALTLIPFNGATTCGNADADATPVYQHVVQTMFAPKAHAPMADWTDTPDPEWNGLKDDLQLIEKMLDSKSAPATLGGRAPVQDVWAGSESLSTFFPPQNPNAPYDRSSADAALCQHLAFWTGKDCERMDRLFRMSGLMRDKWGDREDYRRGTILKAVGMCRNVYGQRDRTGQISTSPPTAINQQTTCRVNLTNAASIRPESISWFWRGWIAAGKVHILAGPAGHGKTTVLIKLGSTITIGGCLPDGTQAPKGDIAMWSGEDDPADTIIPRLLACGADLNRVHIIQGVIDTGGQRSFDPALDIPLLRQSLIGKSIKLLIIDPIVSAVSGDSHKNAEVRRALQPLVDLAAELDCAVYGITHFTKGTAGREPVERVTGSLAFGALTRIVTVATKLPNDGNHPHGARLFARAKSNIGPDGGGFLLFFKSCARSWISGNF